MANSVGYTPKFRILKGNDDITGHFQDRATVIQVVSSSEDGSNDTFQITLDDRDWMIQLPVIGTQLTIELGYAEVGLSDMGLYEINEIYLEGPPKGMRLNGNAAGMTGIMKAPTVKEFDNKTVGDIVKEIAEKGGLEAKVSDNLAKMKLPFLNQFGSAYHMLGELQRRFGAIFKVENGKLVFTERGSGDSVTGVPMPVVIVQPEHMATWSAKITQRADYSEVKAAYWDKDQQKRVIVSSPVEKIKQLANTIGDPTPYNWNKLFNSKDEAEAAVKARAKSFTRSQANVTIELAKGNPWIRSEQPMQIRETRNGLDGMYKIEKVTHKYVKDRGISTVIEAIPADQESLDDSVDDLLTAPIPGDALKLLTPFNDRQVGLAPRGDN